MLGEILEPVGTEEFFDEWWSKKVAVLKHEAPDLLDGLFGLDEIEEYLSVVRPPLGEVRLVKGGEWAPIQEVEPLMSAQTYTTQALYKALGNGYTVVLNSVHRRWPAIQRLALQLENRLFAGVETNVYITGTSSRGFAVHADSHDVLALQTYGVKRWMIYERPGGEAGGAEPTHDIELEQGDALYIPVGVRHAAETSSDFSVHLAVGLYPYTWRQLLDDTIERAVAADHRWSQPVALDQVAGTAPPPRLEELEGRLREGLSTVGDLSAVLEGYRRQLTTTKRRSNPPPSGYLASLAASGSITPRTAVRRRPGIGVTLSVGTLHASLEFMGETLQTPRHIETSLRFITDHEAFRVGEIAGALSDDSKVVLVRRLIREGVLELDS
jgi:ribosomal protein L16 Arg81 hydroxylase